MGCKQFDVAAINVTSALALKADGGRAGVVSVPEAKEHAKTLESEIQSTKLKFEDLVKIHAEKKTDLDYDDTFGDGTRTINEREKLDKERRDALREAVSSITQAAKGACKELKSSAGHVLVEVVAKHFWSTFQLPLFIDFDEWEKLRGHVEWKKFESMMNAVLSPIKRKWSAWALQKAWESRNSLDELQAFLLDPKPKKPVQI